MICFMKCCPCLKRIYHMMKQQIFTFPLSFNLKVCRIILYCFLVIVVTGALLLLPSFSNSTLTSSSLILPFSKSISLEPTTINCRINSAISNGFRAKEASLFKMEQAEGIFAKVLNMSIEDGDGNLVALSLTDLENPGIDSCLTTSLFYGMEHQKSDENFSHDIGSTVFSNKSSLIFEDKKGASLISRNGWIKINRCELGRISGSFFFAMEGTKITKSMEGEFVNVMLEL
jgi:hypothetical protein